MHNYIKPTSKKNQKILLTSGSNRGGIGGGVIHIFFLAMGGGMAIGTGGSGGESGRTATPNPKGRCPLKPSA